MFTDQLTLICFGFQKNEPGPSVLQTSPTYFVGPYVTCQPALTNHNIKCSQSTCYSAQKSIPSPFHNTWSFQNVYEIEQCILSGIASLPMLFGIKEKMVWLEIVSIPRTTCLVFEFEQTNSKTLWGMHTYWK